MNNNSKRERGHTQKKNTLYLPLLKRALEQSVFLC